MNINAVRKLLDDYAIAVLEVVAEGHEKKRALLMDYARAIRRNLEDYVAGDTEDEPMATN